MSEREERDAEETADRRAGRTYDGLLEKFRMLAMWTEECEKMLCDGSGRPWKPSARLLAAYRLLGLTDAGFDGSSHPRRSHPGAR